MKGSPPPARGPSKPTWLGAFGVLDRVGFFCLDPTPRKEELMNQPVTQPKATQPSSNQQTLTAPHPGSAGTLRPTHAEIAKRAYEIYLKKGGQEGHCERNWLQAEQELRTQRMPASQPKPSGDKPTATPSHAPGAR